MALDQLLAVLSREAEAEADAIRGAAQADARSLLERCGAELTERRLQQARALEAERQNAIAFALVAARRAARRDELLARERLLNRVLRLAADRFPEAVRNPVFRATLPALVAQALECLADRPGTIRCHPGLMDEISRLLTDRPGVRLLADPACGTGFRLTSDDGPLVIDATLEDRVERLDRRLRQAILSRLGRGP
jgi:vacuolar-type H+-ATPase subunit E/Vma4